MAPVTHESIGPGAIRGLSFHKKHLYRIPLPFFWLLSVALHIGFMAVADIGQLNLTTPVLPDTVVELVTPASLPENVHATMPQPEPEQTEMTEKYLSEEQVGEYTSVEAVKEPEELTGMPEEGEEGASAIKTLEPVLNDLKTAEPARQAEEIREVPVRKISEFTEADKEKLVYRLSMYGMPVGSGELEATREGNDLLIRWSVRSNPVFSAVYPVSNMPKAV